MTKPGATFLDADQSEAFLRDYWQRSPYFFKSGMPSLPVPPDWRSLAADEAVESRRIVTIASDETSTSDVTRYALSDGPFDGPDPKQPWTVLIQDAEHHAPDLQALIDTVDFLPRWRLEDVMFSVASRGGSVGPHVDAYDVFLVQAQGTRQWDIGAQGEYQRSSDDSALRLVEPFAPTQQLTAKPGDVLYLPPDVPHHGVAQDDCVTYSIGFRAPTLHDLAAVALDHQASEARYRDVGTTRADTAAAIDASTLARLRKQLQDYLRLSDRALAAAMGELMTEPKPWLVDHEADSADELPANGMDIALRPGTRVARFEDDQGTILFANGQSFAASQTDAARMLGSLADTRRAHCPNQSECRQLAANLIENDIVSVTDES